MIITTTWDKWVQQYVLYKLSQIHSLKQVICVTYKRNAKTSPPKPSNTETLFAILKQILCGFNKFPSLHTWRPSCLAILEHTWVCVNSCVCVLDLATISHALIAASLCKHVQLQLTGCSSAPFTITKNAFEPI